MSHGAPGHTVTGSAGRDLYRVTARGIIPHDGGGERSALPSRARTLLRTMTAHCGAHSSHTI